MCGANVDRRLVAIVESARARVVARRLRRQRRKLYSAPQYGHFAHPLSSMGRYTRG